MITLAIETTSPTASAAVVKDGKLLALDTFNGKGSHSVTALPMIDHCLTNLELSLEDVDLLACAAGPGSYTGVRIGVSTLKGLAFARQIPCVGVSSLAAMARQLTLASGLVVPVMNARRNQVYAALFSVQNGQVTRLTDDALWLIPDLLAVLESKNQPVMLTGDAISLVKAQNAKVAILDTPEYLSYPNAFCVAQEAMDVYAQTAEAERSEHFAPGRLSPVYLQKVQAERELEEKMSRGE